MKRALSIIPLLLLLQLGACGSDNQSPANDRKDLLPTSLVHNPQSANGMDTAVTGSLPVLELADTVYHFGNLTDGERVEHKFAFRNAGGGPLIISGAEGSCGCTVADYPREPIPPGASSTLKVVFNSAGKQGHVEKSVLVTSNSATGNRHLYIQAEVAAAKE